MTDFEIEVRNSGGDYTSIVAAESALDENITAADIKVFSFDANTGTIPDGTAVTTDGGSTTGVCVHQSVGGQILIKTIAGGTFDDNDVVTDGTNSVTLYDSGDGASVLIIIYDDQTISTYTDFAGAACDTTNKFIIRGDSSSWDGTTANAVKITSSSELRLNENYYVEYLYVLASSSNYPIGIHSVTAQYWKNIIVEDGGISIYNAGNTQLVNVVIINPAVNGIHNGSDSWGNVYVYDSTIVGAGTYGVYDHVAGWRNQGVRLYNTVVAGSGTADIEQDDQGTLQFCDYVATSDSTATDCGENTETYTLTGIDSDDLTYSTGLIKSGSALIDVGNDYSATTGIDIDITGDTRSGTWDIGADEYVTRNRLMIIQ